MKTKDCFTELDIQISPLNMKLDAILKLLNKPEQTYGNSVINVPHFDARDPEITELVNKALAGLSDNEKFEENFK